MKLLTASPGSLLPRPSERIAVANILLLLALPAVACAVGCYRVFGANGEDFFRGVVTVALGYVGLSLGALLAWRKWLATPGGRGRAEYAAALTRRLGGLARGAAVRHPVRAVWLAALAGVLISCYPVVFNGKSFVSPYLMTELFYGHYPAVPNPSGVKYEWPADSDVGAMMWQHLPYSVIEGRALLQDHELPVWNRFDNTGLPLLGQGQSMIGDPLNLLVVLAGGTSLAWDLKFLAARLLFAAGIGLCVRAATGRLGAACLLAFSACFFQFFTYRLNHPATFSVCYAPLILLAWLRLALDARVAGRSVVAARLGRVALLLGACWLELNSGTAKESAFLLLGLNGVGALILTLDDRHDWRWKAKALAGLAWAGVCFALVSAPLWRTFLKTLGLSWSNYATPRAWQLQPGLLIGLFDDVFYRVFNFSCQVLDPSTNGVVLLGIACAMAFGGRLLRQNRVFLALTLGTLPLLALVFGVVPSAWICAVPFLANVIHVDNTFSCVLVVILPVLAGLGFERGRVLLAARDFGWNYAAVTAVPLLGLAFFQGTTHANQRSNFSPLAPVDGQVPMPPFLGGYVLTLVAAWLAWPLLARWWRTSGGGLWATIPWMAVCAGLLLWRGGIQERAVINVNMFAPYLPPRAEPRVRSAAVDHLLATRRTEPNRFLGFNNTLMGGYSAIFGLEGVGGPDALQNPYYRALWTQSGAPHTYDWQLGPQPEAGLTPALRRFYDLLNVRYYANEVGPGTTAPPEISGLRPVGRFDLDLYESPTAWPRAFFTDNLVPNIGVPDLLEILRKGDGRPFAAVSPRELHARPDLAAFGPLLRARGGDGGRVVVGAVGYRLTSRTTSFRVQAPGPGVAVLMEGYQPDYNARVYLDGQPVAALRLDEAFLGVRVAGAGEHEVRVVYGPRDLPLLLGASLLGLTLLGASAWRLSRATQTADVSAETAAELPAAPHRPLGEAARPVVLAGAS